MEAAAGAPNMMHMARAGGGGGGGGNNGVIGGSSGGGCVGGGNASPYMGEQPVPPPYDLNTGPNSTPNMYPGNSMMDPARSNSHGKSLNSVKLQLSTCTGSSLG